MVNNLNNSQYGPHPRSHSANKHLQEALEKREHYLASHPHLRVYQTEIDEVLDKSGNCYGRMAVLGTLMQGKLLEIRRELTKLAETLQ